MLKNDIDMKKIEFIIFFCLVFSLKTAFYPTLQAKEPYWFKETPRCKDTLFVYAAGIGQDSDAVIKIERARDYAITRYIAEVHGIVVDNVTSKENGLEKTFTRRPILYMEKCLEPDEDREDIFYILLLLPRNFIREEMRRYLNYPDEKVCTEIEKGHEKNDRINPEREERLSKYRKFGKFFDGTSYQVVQRISDRKFGIIDEDGFEQLDSFIYYQSSTKLRYGNYALLNDKDEWEVFDTSLTIIDKAISLNKFERK